MSIVAILYYTVLIRAAGNRSHYDMCCSHENYTIYNYLLGTIIYEPSVMLLVMGYFSVCLGITYRLGLDKKNN